MRKEIKAMEEKRIIQEEEPKKIQNTEVTLEKEEENLGIGYEIVIGSTKS